MVIDLDGVALDGLQLGKVDVPGLEHPGCIGGNMNRGTDLVKKSGLFENLIVSASNGP